MPKITIEFKDHKEAEHFMDWLKNSGNQDLLHYISNNNIPAFHLLMNKYKSSNRFERNMKTNIIKTQDGKAQNG